MNTSAPSANAQARLDQMPTEDKNQQIDEINGTTFTDPKLLGSEIKYGFEDNWIYLAHESQIPNPNDYYTTHVDRHPVIITRNEQGELNAMINACSHQGAALDRKKNGNKATFACTFHGWTFNNSGKLLKSKDAADAGYAEHFNKDGSHDLKKIARFESHRGFLFGSLNEKVKPLLEFLDESKLHCINICF